MRVASEKSTSTNLALKLAAPHADSDRTLRNLLLGTITLKTLMMTMTMTMMMMMMMMMLIVY